MEGKAWFCDVCGAYIGKDYEDGFYWNNIVDEFGVELPVDACSFRCFLEYWGIAPETIPYYFSYLWEQPLVSMTISLEGCDLIDEDLWEALWADYASDYCRKSE